MPENELLVVFDKGNLKLMNVWLKKAKNAILLFSFRKVSADLSQNSDHKKQV